MYCANVARTYVIDPSKEQEAQYKALLRTRRRPPIAALVEGAPLSAAHEARHCPPCRSAAPCRDQGVGVLGTRSRRAGGKAPRCLPRTRPPLPPYRSGAELAGAR